MTDLCQSCGLMTESFTIQKWSVCDLCRFLRESDTQPTKDQIHKARTFLALNIIGIADLCTLANAHLRTQLGMNYPGKPHGGPEMILDLQHLLESSGSPYSTHKWFEALCPFTAGNGHIGRIYWLWQMEKLGLNSHLGFLETWYQQSLEEEVII